LYKPELYLLNISFYLEKRLFSHNSGNIISTSQPSSGSVWDIDIGSKSHTVRSREYNNGVKTKSSAFFIDLLDEARSIEMILTPKSLSSGYLVFNKTGNTETSLSWSTNGTISKSNISGLYINGQVATSATDISSYLYIDEPNYILIVTTNPISGQLWINGKQIEGVRSGVLDDNIYQNIATYLSPSINHLDHYQLYIGKPASIGEDSSLSLTEESVLTYSRDRVIFQIL
jgi:predicted secreted protein